MCVCVCVFRPGCLLVGCPQGLSIIHTEYTHTHTHTHTHTLNIFTLHLQKVSGEEFFHCFCRTLHPSVCQMMFPKPVCFFFLVYFQYVSSLMLSVGFLLTSAVIFGFPASCPLIFILEETEKSVFLLFKLFSALFLHLNEAKVFNIKM